MHHENGLVGHASRPLIELAAVDSLVGANGMMAQLKMNELLTEWWNELTRWPAGWLAG
jgi:hypothetical protein